MVDTPFASFPFVATGAATARTMPDRLAEIKNVLDYGADPTGGFDSTAAIQAAVDWTSGANRGIIYFPLGNYLVSAPITSNYSGALRICFRGEVGTGIFGDVNGWMFDRHLASPNNTAQVVFEKLTFQNSHATGGCIRLGSTNGGMIRDCGFGGFNCVTTEDSVGVSSANINFENCSFGTNGTVTDSNYITIGGGGSIHGCTMSGAWVAVRAYGSGLHIAGNRSERCSTSYLLGLDSGDNNVGLRGFSIISGSCEGCWTAYDLAGLCEGFLIMSSGMLSHAADNSGPIFNVKTSQYGLRVRADCARAGVIQSCSYSGSYDVGGIVVEDATQRGNVVFRENYSVNSGGAGASWVFPSNAYTAQFSNNNEDPTWTLSQLPTGGNVLEGDQFNITDGTNGLAWGATAANTGSHTTHYLVRWNGSNWTVVGK